jgi:hypothetical protein
MLHHQYIHIIWAESPHAPKSYHLFANLHTITAIMHIVDSPLRLESVRWRETAGNPGNTGTKKWRETAGKSNIPPELSSKNGGKVETCAAAGEPVNHAIL